MFLTALPGDFLYLDESGDLGLKEASTPVFVVGILHLRAESALRRTIKRARSRALGGRSKKAELKWSASSPEVRSAVIREICRERELVAGVSAVAVHKGWINPTLAARDSNVRYNFFSRIAMEQGMLLHPSRAAKRVRLTIDARNRRATETLTEYVSLLSSAGDICCSVSVEAADSQRVPQLQAADFVVGSIYEAYAYGDWDNLNALQRAGIPIAARALRKKEPAP